MEKLIAPFMRTLHSLAVPGMLMVMAKTIVFSVIALVWFILFSVLAVSWLTHTLQGHAIADFLPWLGSIGGTTIGWILFPAVMPIITKFFDAQIVLLIDEKDYPDMLKPRSSQFWLELLHDMRFSLMAITLNIVVFPLYMLPIVNLLLFYLLNGYMLGHEFFLMAARRHVPEHEAQELFHRYGTTIILAGIALTLFATIPVINVLTPFLGIAFMVHLYHRLDRRFTIEFISVD